MALDGIQLDSRSLEVSKPSASSTANQWFQRVVGIGPHKHGGLALCIDRCVHVHHTPHGRGGGEINTFDFCFERLRT